MVFLPYYIYPKADSFEDLCKEVSEIPAFKSQKTPADDTKELFHINGQVGFRLINKKKKITLILIGTLSNERPLSSQISTNIGTDYLVLHNADGPARFNQEKTDYFLKGSRVSRNQFLEEQSKKEIRHKMNRAFNK